MRYNLLFIVSLGISLILTSTVVPSTMGQVVHSVPSIESHVEISKLVADSIGETHFTTEKVEWNYWFYSGRRTLEKPVTSFQFYHLKNNLKMGLHPAPRKQFLIIFHGTVQIESSDGEQREFSPGSVLLVTDTAGTRGHKTSVIGKEDVYVAVLAIP